MVGRLDAIVDQLVSDGVTTADKIGLSGFSRGGYNVYFATAHPERTAFAATIANDSFLDDFTSYLEDAAFNNAPSFPSKRSPWEDPLFMLDQDSMFSIDRVRTPTLVTNINKYERVPFEVAQPRQRAVVGAYAANRKPVDAYRIRFDDHELRMPAAKVALQSIAVDWLAFWLLGEEDPAPAKFEQYQRWRVIRDKWHAEQTKEIARGELGFIKTRSGLMYKIADRKVGSVPNTGDSVTIRYTLKTPDGSERSVGPTTVRLVDSPVPDPRFAELPGYSMTVMVDGLDECLRFVHPGETAVCLMPAAIAPSADRASNFPTAPLRYEVEVLGVTPKAARSGA